MMKIGSLYRKLRVSLWLVLFLAGCAALSGAEVFLLWEKDSPAAVFEKTPAGEKSFAFFNQTLRKMGKKAFPVVERKNLPAGKNVIRFRVSPSGNPVNDDFFTIRFPAGNVMEITCTDLSIRWAINHILEKGFTVQHLFP